jgi:hypothetical protein
VTVAQLLLTTTQQTASVTAVPITARGTVPVPAVFQQAVIVTGGRVTGTINSRISLVVTLPGGSTRRWSGEEADARNLLQDLQFGTSAPGGFKDLSCALLRDLIPDADENLFVKVQAIGGGGQVLWEGRTATFPRQTGTSYSVTPGAVHGGLRRPAPRPQQSVRRASPGDPDGRVPVHGPGGDRRRRRPHP